VRPRYSAAAAAALALLPAAAPAVACPERGAYQALEAGYAIEVLSPESPDWTDLELRYKNVLGPRQALLWRLTQASRFDLDDTTAAMGIYWPLSSADTLFAEGSASPTHEVLPRNSLQAAWHRAWGGGWGTQLGVRQLSYTSTDVTIGEFTLERYAGNFRLAYGYGPSRSSTAGYAEDHRLQGGYFYGDFSSAQLVLVAGDEVDRPAGAAVVIPTPVRSAALFGLQQLGCDWGLGWSLSYTELRGRSEGERRGAGLYLHRRF